MGSEPPPPLICPTIRALSRRDSTINSLRFVPAGETEAQTKSEPTHGYCLVNLIQWRDVQIKLHQFVLNIIPRNSLIHIE